MKIGFFPGSFDPIHFGHVNLAIQMLEKLSLKKVIFCPTSISPLKVEDPPKAKGSHRLNMLRLALKESIFEVLDYEVNNTSVSYTIDTLKHLKTEDEIVLILTEESIKDFHLWKEHENILKLSTLAVGVRNKNFEKNSIIISKNNIITTDIFNISSTGIRNRIKNGLYIRHLTFKEVIDYIYENRLYL